MYVSSSLYVLQGCCQVRVEKKKTSVGRMVLDAFASPWILVYTVKRPVCLLISMIGGVCQHDCFETAPLPKRSSEGYSPWSVSHTLRMEPAKFLAWDRPPLPLLLLWRDVVCFVFCGMT